MVTSLQLDLKIICTIPVIKAILLNFNSVLHCAFREPELVFYNKKEDESLQCDQS